jgi:hypothetical protein
MENREQKNRSFIYEKSWLKEEDFLDRFEKYGGNM